VARLQIRRLGYALGAQVGGVDLSQPLDDETIGEIRRAWLEHIVLCFPGQNLDLEQMMAFCGRFGILDDHRNAPENRNPEYPTVKMVSNKPMTVNGKGYAGERSGMIWHADQSYTDHPSTATFLHAKQLPEAGGDTMFANLYVAYEMLSATMKELLEDLSGVHDQALSGYGWSKKSPEQRAADRRRSPPVVHPIIQKHPETGRKVLFMNPRVRQFVGMTEEESKPLIEFLNQHSIAYELVYRHRWTPGDVLMWDNRCAIHIAVQDFDQTQIRRMLRCTLLGPKSGYVYAADEAAPAIGVA
jgi:taurine dioxygenase